MSAASVHRIEASAVRDAARGHWQSILPAMTGVDVELLDGRNHPCPRCGGRDRFRCLDVDNGTLFCNQCFCEKNAGGLAAVMWLRGDTSFASAIGDVAEYLNLVPPRGPRKSYSIPFDPKKVDPPAAKKPAKTYRTASKAMESIAFVMQRDGLVPAGRWMYQSATGKPVAYVLRFNREDGTKEFRPVSLHGKEWIIAGPALPRPLYRLPFVEQASTVFVCEGEKAADAARSLGIVAVTSMNGSKSPDKTDWSPLAGKRVIVLPDNDEPGRRYAAAVTEILSKLTPMAWCSIVDLPGLPDGGDVVDWIGGRSVDEKLKAEFMSVIQSRYAAF